MAATALDNANPTIISASQLPTRQKRAVARQGPDSKYSDVIFQRPSYLSSPFCVDEASWPSFDAQDDGFATDPIDEQEIYGTSVRVYICAETNDVHQTSSQQYPTPSTPSPSANSPSSTSPISTSHQRPYPALFHRPTLSSRSSSRSPRPSRTAPWPPSSVSVSGYASSRPYRPTTVS